MGFEEVVGVQEEEQVAGGVGDAGVAGGGEALVGLVDEADALGFEGGGDGGGLIGGAVVDDEDFDGLVVLSEGGFDGTRDVAFVVVSGHNDGDARGWRDGRAGHRLGRLVRWRRRKFRMRAVW